MPLFSIITITKNNPGGLARTGENIRRQSWRDFEWIVIDGVAEPDDGIYDAMNKGIARSSGDYLIFMNAGDVFADTSTLSRIAEHAGPDFMYGDAIEAGHIKPARRNIAHGMITHHQAMIYARSNLRYDTKYRIAADYKYTVQAIAQAHTCLHLPFPVCVFEQGGISQRNTLQGRREQAAIRRELGLMAPFAGSLQMIAAGVKKICPPVYWALRSRLKTSRA